MPEKHSVRYGSLELRVIVLPRSATFDLAMAAKILFARVVAVRAWRKVNAYVRTYVR